MNQPATAPRPERPPRARPAPTTRVEPIPAALQESLAAHGITLRGEVLDAARMLVAGTLSQVSRLSYGLQLGAVSQWCDEHGLSLLGLSPLDIGALVVARRDGGQTPRSMLSALSFVYRNKADPDSARCQLARRVDRIWKVQNREHLPPPKQAPVLPLAAWAARRRATPTTPAPPTPTARNGGPATGSSSRWVSPAGYGPGTWASCRRPRRASTPADG